MGKTTVCRRVAELARGLGYDSAGVLAPGLLDEDGLPAAYHALMVSDGQRRLLALLGDRALDVIQEEDRELFARVLESHINS